MNRNNPKGLLRLPGRSSLPAMFVMLTIATVLSGCVSSNAGNVYSRSDTRRAYAVRAGEIQSIRAVRIEGTRSQIGTAAGAALGGLAGRTAGHGFGQDAATVAGAVVGGIAGAAAEEALTRKMGFEYVIRMDNGQTVAVVQEDGGEGFQVGDRVRLLEGNGQLRVAR